MRTFLLTLLLLWLAAPALAQQSAAGADRPTVRILTNSFVLPAKFRAMRPLAERQAVNLDTINVETAAGSAEEWLRGADLIILDVPRPNDRAIVEKALGAEKGASNVPSITIGGGQPGWGGLQPDVARRLLGYYSAGSARNYSAFFEAVRLWQQNGDLSSLPPVARFPETGFYHPDAPEPFTSLDALLAWGDTRWKRTTGRVGFVIHSGMVSGMQTGLIDTLVARVEAAGFTPVVFWFEGADPRGLVKAVPAGQIDALVNLTHMMNGKARSAEFLELNIPVIQTTGFREGGPKDWAAATTGIPMRSAAVLLAGPEGWGMSDPIVLSAIEDGAEVPLPEQVEALAGKLQRLVSLRRKAVGEKRLGLMFWNYPAGEKNLAASNLNIPASIENIAAALSQAGYATSAITEKEMIEAGQAMLGALYGSVSLEELLKRDLAEAFPLAEYRKWLDSLSPAKRRAFSHSGSPSNHWAVREVDGVRSFVIPRMKRGNLTIMPQMPRDRSVGGHYHDTAVSPDHLYMAAYLYLRRQAGVDAIVHLGTHGTQEWLAGKDRGLAADDDPFLAVGDLPVFYPYIQDNVGEALQARRRGRAVTISHQTPPFAPSGLYDELRDIHSLIHEYGQLDEGAVRDRIEGEIADAAIAAHMHADLGFVEDDVRKRFDRFLPLLHDHMHELARTAMPLGLHTFGKPAEPDHRLTTIMQQLGKPYYDLVDAEPDELFVDDFAAIRKTAAFTTLERYLRNGEDRAALAPAMKALIERADALEGNLVAPGEIEALLSGLEGRFVAPGSGGDPIRNPDVPSGRNLYAFEPERIPTSAAYAAGADAFSQLVDAFAKDNAGAFPRKIAFSLWSSEAIRHLGVTEAQVLHALGLRPVWDDGGRLRALDIIPAGELGRPRVDVVIQVTSVYRDQFDSFMRLLADAIDRIAALEGTGNPIAENSDDVARSLRDRGIDPDEARALASLRIFSNAPASYGSDMSHLALASTTWNDHAALAERFLDGTRYAYGTTVWGEAGQGTNLFAAQLKGSQAAVMSRSSNLHGVLSTDHPFEFLGGLSSAIRHLDGKSPALYVSDLREKDTTRISSLASYLSGELRTRYLNPHWIDGMKAEGYAGTLEMLKTANNLFGWQVVDPSTVRADQWQALFDTYVADARELDLNEWFETHNPTAQAQLMERMVEAIRKGYWDAGDATRRQLVERWTELATDHGVEVGEPATKDFIEAMARGFAPAEAAAVDDGRPSAPRSADQPEAGAVSAATPPQPVSGQVLEDVSPSDNGQAESYGWAMLAIMTGLIAVGGCIQWRANAGRT